MFTCKTGQGVITNHMSVGGVTSPVQPGAVAPIPAPVPGKIAWVKRTPGGKYTESCIPII